MKTPLLILVALLPVANAPALDADRIRRLASEPHDRSEIIEALKIYPSAREYRATASYGPPGTDLKVGPEVPAKEKVVRGRYIVTELRFPGAPGPAIMIVTYDKASDTFRKWVLLSNGDLGSSTGVADFEKRTIAWVSDQPSGDPPATVLSIETHSDDGTSWKETFLREGKVVNVIRGVAKKTK